MSEFDPSISDKLEMDERLFNTVRTGFGDVRFPHLLTTEQVSRLLRVHQRTVSGWIQKGTVPYIEFPRPKGSKRREIRLPADRLAQVLGGNYDATEIVANFCEQEFRS